MIGQRVALIKELVEQRYRMRSLDDLEARVFIKSLSTLKCMGLAEGTIVSVVEAVVRGSMKGVPLRQILINYEQLRRLRGEIPLEFNIIIRNISEHEIIGPVANYLEYRLVIEESGYGKANLSPSEILLLVTLAFQEISRWFSVDHVQNKDENLNHVKDSSHNNTVSSGADIEIDAWMVLKVFFGISIVFITIMLIIISINSMRDPIKPAVVSQVEQAPPAAVVEQGYEVESPPTEESDELPAEPLSSGSDELATQELLSERPADSGPQLSTAKDSVPGTSDQIPKSFVPSNGTWTGIGRDEGSDWEIVIKVANANYVGQIVGESSYQNTLRFLGPCLCTLELISTEMDQIVLRERKNSPLSRECIFSPAGKDITLTNVNGDWSGTWRKRSSGNRVTMFSYLQYAP